MSVKPHDKISLTVQLRDSRNFAAQKRIENQASRHTKPDGKKT